MNFATLDPMSYLGVCPSLKLLPFDSKVQRREEMLWVRETVWDSAHRFEFCQG